MLCYDAFMKKFLVVFLVAVILVACVGFVGIEMLATSRPFANSGEADIPILMYHNVSPWVPSFSDENRSLTVKPEDFAAQMEYLHKSGFTPITLKELNLIWRGKQPMPPKPIVLTFDDGDRGVYQYAYPVLQRYRFHFVVFLITRWTPFHTTFYMGKNDVLEMLKSGLVELGSHTRNHVNLEKASPIGTFYEICVSKRDIEELFDYDVTSFCFPFGGHTKIAIAALRVYGYTVATTETDGLANRNQGPYLLKRMKVDGTEELQSFISKVTGLPAQ
jgi:peptidoglycan/xylan/chitin deacetylase (PgdA/CDA1 family)